LGVPGERQSYSDPNFHVQADSGIKLILVCAFLRGNGGAFYVGTFLWPKEDIPAVSARPTT
jgi:hypothetical protein